MRLNSAAVACLTLGTSLVGGARPALAEGHEGGSSHRSFAFSLPLLAVGGEAVAKGEFNLAEEGGLTVGLNVLVPSEAYSNKEMKAENMDTLVVNGSELNLLYSRYTRPKSMSGGYWAAGLGYRQMHVNWHRTPDEAFNLSHDAPVLDENDKVTHTLAGHGMTARTRIGYRFIGESFPIALGAYLGMRHFQSEFKDSNTEGAASTSDAERGDLSRRFMSSLEPGLEFGLAF